MVSHDRERSRKIGRDKFYILCLAVENNVKSVVGYLIEFLFEWTKTSGS